MMILKHCYIFDLFLLLSLGVIVLGESVSKCYQCTECPQGCLRKDVLVNAEDPGNVNNLDRNGESEDDKIFASISPIQCCEASELPLPVCEDCKVCPDTGCNLLTGECCFSPEDVHGGCAPCLECDQCIANTTTCCPATKNCPMRKTVGGVDYTLSYTGQVLSGCLHDCVYHRDDDSSARFCFERGNQTVSYERGRNKLAINHTINNDRRWNTYQIYYGLRGTWGIDEFCKPGSFVFGYSLRSETGVGSDFDDTALNSVSLKCRSPGSSWTSQYLYSRTGYWGYWSSPRYCSGTDNPVVGFKVKFERSQGGGDDTAANDIDLYCQKDEIISAYVRSDWGSWSTWHRCPSGMAVTGLQTRVESQQGGDDDTALNGFLIYCDYYPVDGYWGSWQPWSSCSKSCGGGVRSRQRTCYGPYHGGKECAGGSAELSVCNSQQCPNCKCGQKKTSRIVGGVETEVNEYPWMAGLAKSSEYYIDCGATLVSAEWVVTAAHCLTRKKEAEFTPNNQRTDPECDAQQGECKDVRDCEPEGVLLDGYCPSQPNNIKCCKPNFKQPGDFVIGIGEHDQDDNQETTLTKYLDISKVIPHPEYRPYSILNDIALLKLTQLVDLNIYTPACLPENGEDFTGKLGHIYGWGGIKFVEDEDNAAANPEDYESAILLEATQRILSRSDCLKVVSWTVRDGMLCAGGVVGTDTCQGDSGGPLTVEDAQTQQHTLAGATSFGYECARGTPGVYADVAFYRYWLDSEMTGASFCPP